jgi:hypothetical protein
MVKIKDFLYILGITISIFSNLYSLYKFEKKSESFNIKLDVLSRQNLEIREELIHFKAASQTKLEIMTEKFKGFNDKINYQTMLFDSKLQTLNIVAEGAVEKRESINIITNSSNINPWSYICVGVAVIGVSLLVYFYLVKPLNSSSESYQKWTSWFSWGNGENNGNSASSGSNNNSPSTSFNSSDNALINKTDALTTLNKNYTREEFAELFAETCLTSDEQNGIAMVLKKNPEKTTHSLFMEIADRNEKVIEYRSKIINDDPQISSEICKELCDTIDNLF